MKRVFQDCNIGVAKLKNRIIRSATHEGMADIAGRPTGDLIRLYEKLAKGGVGAIITGYTGAGRTLNNMLMFDRGDYAGFYKKINDRLKQYGTPVFLQIAHGGSKACSAVTKESVVAPSERKKNLYGDFCREVSEKEIEEIITAFVNTVLYAKYAGFAGVQLHAAHGYLLSEFLSPATNKRTDKWGGDCESRFRIIREILLRAKEAAPDFPILMKFSARDENSNGLKEDESVLVARMLEESGCDAIEVSCGYGIFLIPYA